MPGVRSRTARRAPSRRRPLLTAALLMTLPLAPAAVAVPAAGGSAEAPAASAGRHHAHQLHQRGSVRTGDRPIPFAKVRLFQAADQPGGAATELGSARADAKGRFDIAYRPPADDDAVRYLIADAAAGAHHHRAHRAHRSGPVRLAAVPSARGDVVINERTTVATAYALAQFTEGADIGGSYPGPHNAAATAHNLADMGTGGVSRVLATPPNGRQTSTLRGFNSLANLLSGCVRVRQLCPALLRAASPEGGPAATDTFQAAVNIARRPGRNASALFGLAQVEPTYRPALAAAPDAWTVALRYWGNGRELGGPGNVAFDADGNAWIINNYQFNPDPRQSVCGGTLLSKFTPTGQDAPGAPFSGGGVYGAGFGVTLDPSGDVWVGNFGFQGRGCPLDKTRLNRSVSQFAPDGTPLSPPVGWRQGDINAPMGMVSDRGGNIWVANCGSDSVTRIAGGDPDRARNIPFGQDRLDKPFGIAVDTAGRAWVTGNRTDNVVRLSPRGRPELSVDGGGIVAPMGIASDSKGNVWVANSAIADPPCGPGETPADLIEQILSGGVDLSDASVTMIRPDGTTPAEPFQNGGLTLPWGIAVDGDDTVWVANFAEQRLARLCGADTSTCPSGHRTGDPISPADTGYTFDGLARNTGVQIDPSGNVWLANNWDAVPLQTNPGGHHMVVFVGLAAPVKAPLLGPPQRP